MAHSTEGSLLEKLLKSHYPLTNYLYRQQQFIKAHPVNQSVVVRTPAPPPEATITAAPKRKTPLSPPLCFNVPDTLDFYALEYERNDEVDQGSGMEDDGPQDFDETLLKSISNRINGSNSDIIHEKNASIVQRSSAIQLYFSPYENNSPVKKAIRNGTKITESIR